jgi:hypothetical protein
MDQNGKERAVKPVDIRSIERRLARLERLVSAYVLALTLQKHEQRRKRGHGDPWPQDQDQ